MIGVCSLDFSSTHMSLYNFQIGSKNSCEVIKTARAFCNVEGEFKFHFIRNITRVQNSSVALIAQMYVHVTTFCQSQKMRNLPKSFLCGDMKQNMLSSLICYICLFARQTFQCGLHCISAYIICIHGCVRTQER